MDKLRILVCGGRHFSDYALLEKTINGVIAESAEWEKYGKRAGPIRNKQMVDYISGFKNKIVIAFVSANTKGTRNTIALAKKANILVIEKEYNGRENT